MSNPNQSYLCSFTSGGLLHNECLIVADTLAQTADWKETHRVIAETNLFQTRTQATFETRFREVRRRLSPLTNLQMTVLKTGVQEEQNAMIWLGICKAYRIIREFAVEIVRQRFLTMQYLIAPSDFERFLDEKSILAPDLEKLAESTRSRLKQIVTQMLRETGIIVDGLIQPFVLSPRTVAALTSDSHPLFQIYPVSDQDFRRLAG